MGGFVFRGPAGFTAAGASEQDTDSKRRWAHLSTRALGMFDYLDIESKEERRIRIRASHAGRLDVHSRSLGYMGHLVDAVFKGAGPGSKPRDVSAVFKWLPGGARLLLGDITISSSAKDGVPVDKQHLESSRAEIKILRPTFSVDFDGDGRGVADLSIEDKYPDRLSSPLVMPIRFRTSNRGISGDLRLGPITVDFDVNVSYDTARLAGVIVKALSLGEPTSIPADLLKELSHPNIIGRAAVELTLVESIPFLNEIMISLLDYRIEARQIAGGRLMGALLNTPYAYRTIGLIPIPPGGFKSYPLLGAGYTHSDFGAKGGWSFTAGALGLPNTDAISAGDMGKAMTGYVYVEYFRVKRVTSGLDLGVRVTLMDSTLDSTRVDPPPQVDYLQATAQPWLPASRTNVALEENKPQIMFRLDGRFDAF